MELGTLEADQFCKEHNVAVETYGDIVFIWYILECPKCGCQRSVQEMFEIERAAK